MTDRYLNVPRDGTITGAATQRPARDLRPIHGTGRITKYGVCIVTFTGSPRITSMGADWFNRAFDDADGIVTFFRTATGGRHDIEWQVFGPIDLMTLADKVALDTGPENRRQRTVDAFRQAAAAKGIPVGNFDRFLWVIDQPGSQGGTMIGDTLMGAFDFTPQIACHEMSHAFGLFYDFYPDAFCLMGAGPVARSFQNGRLVVPAETFTHATTGPNLCTPCLTTLGWLESLNIVSAAHDGTLLDPAGARLFGVEPRVTLHANQGAPASGISMPIALTIGSRPGVDPSQLWLEYRVPEGFDREIDRPVATHVPDLPREGALVLHAVHLAPAVPFDTAWVAAVPGATLSLPGASGAAHVVTVDASARTLVVRLQ